jgi:hypothetical protein
LFNSEGSEILLSAEACAAALEVEVEVRVWVMGVYAVL